MSLDFGKFALVAGATLGFLWTRRVAHGCGGCKCCGKKTGKQSDEAVRERSFIMIKPDGVQRKLVGEIMQRFESKGYKLVACKMVHSSIPHMEKHYEDLKGKPFFNGLVKFMTSGVVVAMVWEGTIRGDYAVDVGRNIIHGSDSVESANKEIEHWFPEGVKAYRGASDSWVYEN
ncbi:NDKP1 [Symbiodinium sp. KB8]|nr:NDKP1 [Symbiodinium sp. KB8]